MAESGQQKHEADGVALAVTFLLSGGLCVFAPGYFDATGWQETAWHVAGVLLATLGAGGLIAELSPGSGQVTLSDLGLGIVMFTFALGSALILAAWSPPTPLSGLLRWLVAFSVFFGLYGTIAGLRQWSERRVRGKPRRRWETAASVLVAVLGLVTAAVNLYAAFAAVPDKP